MRATGGDYAAATRGRHAVALALMLADTTIDDPAALIDETPLFWEIAAAHTTTKTGVKVQPPTSAEGVQQVVTALRSIRADRDRCDGDVFAGFPKAVL